MWLTPPSSVTFMISPVEVETLSLAPGRYGDVESAIQPLRANTAARTLTSDRAVLDLVAFLDGTSRRSVARKSCTKRNAHLVSHLVLVSDGDLWR